MFKFGCLIAVVAVITASCSSSQLHCDNPDVISALRKAISGSDAGPDTEPGAWLKTAIQVTVLNESRDDSGRHLTCAATINIPQEALRGANELVGIFEAVAAQGKLAQMPIQYIVTTDTANNATVVVSPGNKESERTTQTIRTIIAARRAAR